MIDMLKKIAEEEHGCIEDENTTIGQIGLDSFGYVVFFLEVEQSFGVKFQEDWEFDIDYKTFTISQLIAKIEELKSEIEK